METYQPTEDSYLLSETLKKYLNDKIKNKEINQENQEFKILDMGSGFSSYVFSKYASECDYPVQIVSVDTDQFWLAKTIDFLKTYSLQLDTPILLEDLEFTEGSFDLVFHDIASADQRNLLMSVSISALKGGGIIIFDDLQHPPHLQSVLENCAIHNLIYSSLKEQTLDKIGRWAGMGVRA